VLIVGESLNASIPAVAKAVSLRDGEAIGALARRQAVAGAGMLDLNAAVNGRDECEDLAWMVRTVQAAVDLPLMLDSSNPAALRAVLEDFSGPPPILSSVTAEAGSAEGLLPLALSAGCGLVALCMDEQKISPDPELRCAIARDLVERLCGGGLPRERLYLDPMVLTIGTDTSCGLTLLRLIALLRERFPGVRTICGASNVSFGMPERRLLNRSFVPMLAAAGMESFLVDVKDRAMMATLRATAALLGQDRWCREYIKAHREGRLGTPAR
jgi:cobalamin-dependent methionine synthase I